MHSILLLFRRLIPFHSVIPFYSVIVSLFCMYGVLNILTCFISLQIVSFINPSVFCCSYCPRVNIFYMYVSMYFYTFLSLYFLNVKFCLSVFQPLHVPNCILNHFRVPYLCLHVLLFLPSCSNIV